MRFSLRIDASTAPAGLTAKLERALELVLAEVDRHGLSLREGHALGMQIHLMNWVGLGLQPIFRLSGYTTADEDWPENASPRVIWIDDAIIDLLRRRGAGEWHVPTSEELSAERSPEALANMEGEDPGPPDDWPAEGN
jgi:hypothetical protein